MTSINTVATRRYVPYSPDALRLIREGAGWVELGWQEHFYRRICQKHGIAGVIIAKAARHDESSDAANGHFPFQDILGTPWPKAKRRQIIIKDREHNLFPAVDLMLGRHATNIVFALAQSADGQINRTSLMDHSAIKSDNPKAYGLGASQLRTALIRTPLDLLSMSGYLGGFRMVLARDRTQAVRIRIVAFDGVELKNEETQ